LIASPKLLHNLDDAFTVFSQFTLGILLSKKTGYQQRSRMSMAGIELTRTIKTAKTKARQSFADFDGPL
jgi:hypothetical protein